MTSRTQRTARQHAVILVVVFAVLGQVLFPHVHAWQGRGVTVEPDVALARCTSACPSAFTASAARDAGGEAHQHSSNCPLCRAQNDARSLMFSPSYVGPLPATAPSVPVADPVSSTAAVDRSLAAPRAPPFTS